MRKDWEYRVIDGHMCRRPIYQCHDFYWTYSEHVALKSYIKAERDAEYNKCKNPISRWWFRLWN